MKQRLKRRRVVRKGNVNVHNMGERWRKFRSGTLRTLLATFLYVLTLPAVRNWIVNLVMGKKTEKKAVNAQVIDVKAKK